MTTDAHALTCESIESKCADSILSWLRSKERRAGLLWARLAVEKMGVEDSNRWIDGIMVSSLTLCVRTHIYIDH